MHVIEKLRKIWKRYGDGFNRLSPYELDEFIPSRLAGIWTCRPSNRRVPRSSADAGRLHITPAVGLYDEDIPF